MTDKFCKKEENGKVKIYASKNNLDEFCKI